MVRSNPENVFRRTNGSFFQIPGFNLTAKDLLDSPSGEWISRLGSFNTVVFPLVNDSRRRGSTKPGPLSGIGLADKETLRKLSIAGKNQCPRFNPSDERNCY